MANQEEFENQLSQVIELNDSMNNLINHFVTQYNSVVKKRNDIIESTKSVVQALNDPTIINMLPALGESTQPLNEKDIEKVASGDYNLQNTKEAVSDFLDPAEIENLIPVITDSDEFGTIPNDSIPDSNPEQLYMEVSATSDRSFMEHINGKPQEYNKYDLSGYNMVDFEEDDDPL